jgi:hypothetical protein
MTILQKHLSYLHHFRLWKGLHSTFLRITHQSLANLYADDAGTMTCTVHNCVLYDMKEATNSLKAIAKLVRASTPLLPKSDTLKFHFFI